MSWFRIFHHWRYLTVRSIPLSSIFFLCFFFIVILSKIKFADDCDNINQERIYNIRQRFVQWPIRKVEQTTKLIYKGNKAFFYSFRTTNCIVNNCMITTDLSMVRHSSAVLINWFFQPRKVMREIKRQRQKDQRWVFTTMESPSHEADMLGFGRIEKYFKRLNGLFNWTMTYRQDSDIPRSYGRFTVRKNVAQGMESILPSKPKQISWLVSNCISSSKRASYVAELEKYITVDILGKCGKNAPNCSSSTSPQSRIHCYQSLAKEYNYFLSFENSICKDYITEKSYDVVRYDIIPVVMGGANYSRFMPKNSYINIADFSSPKSLALFLLSTAKNRSRYTEYFNWRTLYKLEHAPGENEYCDLCRKLNDPSEPMKIYHDFYHWWVKGSNCRTWKYL